jgi:hypothetical protein
MVNVVKLYKNLGYGLSMYQYGVFTLSMSLVVDMCMRVGSLAYGVPVTESVLILFVLSLYLKFGLLLAFGLNRSFLQGWFSKVKWAKCSLIMALVTHSVVFGTVAFLPSWGIAVSDFAVLPSCGMLLFSLVMLRISKDE